MTGAAGFVGSHLAEALLARGDTVVGVDCFTPYYDRIDKEQNIWVADKGSDMVVKFSPEGRVAPPPSALRAAPSSRLVPRP